MYIQCTYIHVQYILYLFQGGLTDGIVNDVQLLLVLLQLAEQLRPAHSLQRDLVDHSSLHV